MIKLDVKLFIEKNKNKNNIEETEENIWERIFTIFKKSSSFAISNYRKNQYYMKKK